MINIKRQDAEEEKLNPAGILSLTIDKLFGQERYATVLSARPGLLCSKKIYYTDEQRHYY
jgi:hypothetical protein